MLKETEEKAVAGIPATIEQCLALAESETIDDICDAAHRIRLAQCGTDIDTCSIVNARSNMCPEDCKWCSQSRHHATAVDTYAIIGEEECLDLARRNQRAGVIRYSLVTSGRRISAAALTPYCNLVRQIKEQTGLYVCASMGLLGPEEMRMLREAGVERYHCNLETSSDFFPTLCTTHTHADKLATIRAAREAGLEVCSGGIIGMGETLAQRLRLTEECRDAGAVSMPMNLLNPIAGTPLENMPLIEEDEVVLTAALMRFVAPAMVIRFAGGRKRLSRRATVRMLTGGVNGVMIGDLLTTAGNVTSDDMQLIENLKQ